MDARFPLVRQIAFLELRAPLGRDVPRILRVDPNIDAIGRVFVQEAIGELTPSLERSVLRNIKPSVAVVRAINSL